MIHTAGVWDPTDRHVYFLAAGLSRQQWARVNHGYVLLAVNDITTDKHVAVIEDMLERGAKVLLDSGVFWLTNEHKRAHGITMNEALQLAPEDIDGFDWLWERYCKIVTRFGDRVWGYIELDQGGRENKKKTRAKLNDLGLKPIPVYHPLNDGAEYFDELATTSDRICWGNVVQANAVERKAMLWTLWDRHRQYPDLWVHVLGLTPNQYLNALPVDSADSSTWLNVVRWDGYTERSMLRALSKMDPNYKYRIGETGEEAQDSDKRALAMSAFGMSCLQRGWRHWQERVEDQLGLPLYPAP